MQARLADLSSIIGDNSGNGYIDKENPSLRPVSIQFPSSSVVIAATIFYHTLIFVQAQDTPVINLGADRFA